MNKMLAVLKREYLQAVRKKSFIIITLTMPVLMGALMFIPSILAVRGIGEKKIVIVDGTGRLEAAVTKPREAPPKKESDKGALEKEVSRTKARNQAMPRFTIEYVNAAGSDPKKVAEPQFARLDGRKVGDEKKVDGVLVIPGDVFENRDATMSYYSRSSTDVIAQERLGRTVNDEVQRTRLTSRGIAEAELETVLDRVDLDAVQLTSSGEEKTGGELNFLVGFLFAALLLIPSLVYGMEVMRGIVQEKTDRVVEVLISSLTPMQLLSGKILGLAAVGLTQLTVWILMGVIAAVATGGAAAAAGFNAFQFLRPEIGAYFAVFFILGYLLYVCFYAIAGAVCNSEKEAQQFVQPVMLVLMIPWFLMMPIIMNPESKLSVGLSLFPLFAPITMFVRVLVSEPPFWHVALSIVLSVGAIYGLFWLTAKIFRIGILSYGKRPTIPELWKWTKVA
ncbi:MAG: ABC transporter permease [Acidobacteria bacterium]|nr:ABC transporter permease [Acidobacteriota bacterium]